MAYVMLPELGDEGTTMQMIYHSGENLGKGSLGSVFAVSYDSHVVLKEYRRDGIPEGHFNSILSKMSTFYRYRHPNIPKYGAIAHRNDFTYLPTSRHNKFLENIILHYLRVHKQLPNKDIFDITHQVACALAYLHDPNKKDEAGNPLPTMVHGNLKPCNIIAEVEEGRYLVTDFGIYADGQSMDILTVRTPTYLSPEAAARYVRTVHGDMWSLGVVLYELTAAKRPRFMVDVPSVMHVEGWVPDVKFIKNQAIRSILEQLLVFCPEDRISAVQYLETLDDNMEYFDLPKDYIDKTISAKLTTYLMRAAYYNDISLVKTYVKYNTFIRMANNLGMTALMYAAKLGHTEIVKELVAVENGLKNIDGWTALMWAARYGCADAANVLIEYEGRYANNIGRTALMIAAFYGSSQVVKILLKREIKMKDNNGKTALMHAAKHGRLDVVKLLMADESSMVDQCGRTAIMYAAAYGHLDVVKILLPEEGDIKTMDGETPLHFAARATRANIVEFLDPTDSNGTTSLMRAMARGDIHLVKLLYPTQGRMANANGVSPHGMVIENNWNLFKPVFDPENKYGVTPLMLAAMTGDTATVKALIPLYKRRAIKYNTYQTRLTENSTALMHAVFNGHSDCVKLLMQDEAGMGDCGRNSALMIAILSKNLDIAELLVEKENQMVTRNGVTALIYLAGSYIMKREVNCPREQIDPRKNYTDIHQVIKLARLLAMYEIGFKDLNGWTALMHAVEAGQDYLVDILIAETHHQSIRSYKNFPAGTTALMIAVKTGQTQIVQKLAHLERGFFDGNGKCALMIALEAGHISCVSLLLDELHAMDVAGRSCYTKIVEFYEARGNTNCSTNSYYLFKSVFLESFISKLHKDTIHGLLKLINASVNNMTEYPKEGIDMLLAALCCEHEDAATIFMDYIHEANDEAQENLCAVCMTNKRNCVLLPCKHLLVCLDCAQLMLEENIPQKCPYCRADIFDKITISDFDCT